MKNFSIFILAFSVFLGCSSVKSVKEDIKEGKFFTKKEYEKDFFHYRWIKNLDLPRSGEGLAIGINSPHIHNGILYQGALDGRFMAYSIEDGRVIWSAKETHAIGSSASIFKNQVIYGTMQGSLVSRDAISGNLNWNVDLGASIQSSPTFYKGRVLLHTRNHNLVCLDASTGKILWAFKRSIPYSSSIQGYSEPYGYKNQVIIGFADGYVVSVALDDGLLIWEKKLSSSSKFVDVDASPRVYEDKLYVGSLSGRFSVLDPNNGNLVNQFNYSASAPPLFIKKNIFLPTIDGMIVKIEEKGNTKVEKKIVLDAKAPVTDLKIWKGYLIAANTKGRVYQIDTESLEVKNSIWLGSELSAIYGKIQVKEGVLALISSRSRLYVLE